MIDQQTLQAVIEKAVKNGCELPVNGYGDKEWAVTEWLELKAGFDDYISYEKVIFDFSFAKALWGEGGCKGQTKHHHECSYVCQADWKHHLQQLSIAENRIEYLKQFVE